MSSGRPYLPFKGVSDFNLQFLKIMCLDGLDFAGFDELFE